MNNDLDLAAKDVFNSKYYLKENTKASPEKPNA